VCTRDTRIYMCVFPVILGNQLKMELLYQKKEFAAGQMSGNERSHDVVSLRQVNADGRVQTRLCTC